MSIEERKDPSASSDAVPGTERKTLARASGFEVRTVPDELQIGLHPRPAAVPRHRSLWHAVHPKPGLLVSLTSRDNVVRRVRLSVRSDDRAWRPGWVRWTYAVRAVSELIGGDAVSAQDVLADDERSLVLLLLPWERREATLEFPAYLDGDTRPGDYLLDIVATDIGDGGEEDATSAVLRLRHPAPSLLEYLPSIYRECCCPHDASVDGFTDRAFFQRFLLGFEDAQSPVRSLLDGIERFFGAEKAPPDFVSWLATWAALALDENWPELKRRRLIGEAAELFRWRGTARGLSRYLEIYTGIVPEINDRPFHGMRLGPQTLLGRDTILGDVPPHTFVVTLAVPDVSEINEQIVRDIIESEKPAHTGYALRIVRRTEEARPA